MKKLFSLIFALILSIGSIWADFGIGVGATFTQVQLQATTTSNTCKTYKLKIFAINPYSGSEAGVVVVQSVTMNSATSIKGSHSFTVTSGTSSWFVNQFTSSTGGVYLEPYSSSYPLSGTVTFTFKSYDEVNNWPIYTVNVTNGTGVNDWTYYTGGMLDNIVDLPVKTFKNDNSTRITLTDYYKITLSSNNESYGTVSGGGYYASATSRTITATPKPGYNFVQWSDGNTNASRTFTLNSNVTYTATFAPAQYSITYKDQSNAAFSGVHESGYPTTHTYGTATKLKNATKDDYTFDGWFTSSDCSGSPVTSLGATAYTSNITLYAKWIYAPAGSTYTLLLDKTGNGTVTVRDADNGNALVAFTNNEAQVTEGHNVSITASPAAGYHLTTLTFADEPVDQNETYEMSEDNITLVAVFEPDVYTITYRDKNNAAFTGTHGSGYPTTHTYGTATNLVNATRDGYTFGGWYTSQNCTGAAITSLGATAYTSAPTVYAKWRGTITTTVSPSSTYGAVTAGGTYDLNTSISLTASSKNDRYYKFDHWEKDGDTYVGGATIAPTVTGNATYTAVFRDAKAGTITATVNNASYGTATASPSDNQPGGTAVTLTASAKSGYAFTGWDDNNDGVVDNTDAVRTVYVDGDKEYVAKFVVETASWANYSYDNAQDIIQRDIYQESSVACEAYYSPAGQKFVEVIAVNKSRSTKNYLQLYFKTTTTNYTYPDGEIGPTPGTYLANSGVGDRITSDLVLCPGEIFESNLYFWNWNSWPYECVIGYFKDNTGTGLGENDFSAFLADVNYSSQKPSTTNTYQIGNNNFRIIVDTGKDGHMYLQVRRVSNNELLVNIGEPAQHYDLAWDANGGELSGTYTAAGSYEAGATITAPTTTKPGYILTQWRDTTNSVNFNGTMPSNSVTYTAQWEVAERTVTITAPTGGTITVTDGTTAITSGSQAYSPDITITLTATPATDYEFVSWNSGTPALTDETTEDGVVSGTFTLTKDTTVGATFRRVRYDELTLLDNESADYYNTFADDYDDVDVETVTYSRTFRANTWSTVCLPFYVNEDNLSGAGWLGSVYEFKHAEGTANVGDGLYLNFYPAHEMEAGKGYLVYSQGAALEGGFEFYDVTIKTDADTEPTITDLAGYNDGQGTITLVGTLRQGTLTPNTTSQMALKDNKVWYPGSGTTTIRAYRGFFKDNSGSPIPPRVHIVVEGEVVTDLEIMENGELRMDNAEVRKYMDNGVLIIERNGIRYDAQGKRIEN